MLCEIRPSFEVVKEGRILHVFSVTRGLWGLPIRNTNLIEELR